MECVPRCNAGGGCESGADCISAVCIGGTCQAASCTDGVKNGSESAIDCGGSCGMTCNLGEACRHGTDCVSGNCNGSMCILSPCGGETSGMPAGCRTQGRWATATASRSITSPQLAISQNCGNWNSGAVEPQWLRLDFGMMRRFSGITLVPAMSPTTGDVTHVIEHSGAGSTWGVLSDHQPLDVQRRRLPRRLCGRSDHHALHPRPHDEDAVLGRVERSDPLLLRVIGRRDWKSRSLAAGSRRLQGRGATPGW